MRKFLAPAEKLAEKIRFSGDQLKPELDGERRVNNVIKSYFYQSGLQITQEVTPHLYLNLLRACDRLEIPISCFEAFVYASPEIQAECYSSGAIDCTLRFTSSFIDLLDNDELEFVIGHELGHFLLHHSMTQAKRNDEDLEYYIQQRAQEISADRLGLMACGSLDVAIRTLIKMVSGLSTHHLRLDTGTFISQLQKSKPQNNMFATHPSVIVRSRALLWFSLGETFQSGASLERSPGLDILDERINHDLDKYVDSDVREKIAEVKNDLYMWMAAYKVVEDGKFDKNEQKMFIVTFGEETFNKFLNFLNGLSEPEILNCIHEKLVSARNELEDLIPANFNKEINQIESKLNLNFK